MPRVIAITIEYAIAAGILWLLFFLSTFLHEAGHALGYMIAAGDMRWHIRVGSGKTLLDTRRLTVKLIPFDGCFVPLEKSRIDTTAKLVSILSGGPAVSLILSAALLLVKLSGISFHSEVIASDAIEFFISSALSINLFILVLSLIPAHYFYGEVKGMETDGLQIINAIRSHSSKQ